MVIRDALNRRSRKPFYWGELVGYQQLGAIASGLHQLIALYPKYTYFQQLSRQVDRTVAKSRTLANNLNEAHHWLRKVANCLRYPPEAYPDAPVTSQQVAQEMQHLLKQFQPDRKHQRPQSALAGSFAREDHQRRAEHQLRYLRNMPVHLGNPDPEGQDHRRQEYAPRAQRRSPQPTRTVFFYDGSILVAVRDQHWKYQRRHMSDNGGYPLFSQGPFLFDLEKDPSESYNLIETYPEVA